MLRHFHYVLFSNGVALTTLLPFLALAHEDGGHMNQDGGYLNFYNGSSPEESSTPMTYFHDAEHSNLMVAHIVLMTLAWVFVLPIGVMFSISRSRYSILAQSFFLVLNTLGVVMAMILTGTTPDYYPSNFHHKLGWGLSWVVTAQLVISVIRAYTRRKMRYQAVPVSENAIEELHLFHEQRFPGSYRFSDDSGHGTEPRTVSTSSAPSSVEYPMELREFVNDATEDEGERKPMGIGRLDKFISRRLPAQLRSRLFRPLVLLYGIVDRTILLLGFAAIMTGGVTYGGLFTGDKVYSGLAHFLKGGVFFWFGILSLGRWSGCFSDIGWAWNATPKGAASSWRPSAEFVESFLIFFYGSTNVFLEHLNAWGKEWSAQDLEHISLTFIFFGGGLCGMLIESTRIRSLLNPPKRLPDSYSRAGILDSVESRLLEEPKSYAFPMNPFPALVILLLGVMMSSHHQESMTSTMIHAQWGTLLVGAAFARGATYLLYYLSPPTSHLPGRPPTELITAFCLMAGGTIFMASARDVVETIEANNLDAMFIFTVSMGIVTFLMAWVITVIAVKGWTGEREGR